MPRIIQDNRAWIQKEDLVALRRSQLSKLESLPKIKQKATFHYPLRIADDNAQMSAISFKGRLEKC